MFRLKISQKGSSFKSGQELILAIILILIIGSVMMVGGFSKVKTPEPPTSPSNLIVATESPGQVQNNLQLKTFGFITATPVPAPVCSPDDGVCHPLNSRACCPDIPFYCSQGKCIGIGQLESSGKPKSPCIFGDLLCQQSCGNNDGFTCVGKPVIYLYPETRISVDVEVRTSGSIVVSSPLYHDHGWKNVEALPGGNLIYEGKNYKELFYESEVKGLLAPQNGIIIASFELENKLREIVHRLGLNATELEEFLDFWVPRLKSLNSPYVLFSTIDREVKEANDKIVINPEPATRIEFITYFKPLNFPIAVEPLKLPERPTRQGFTMIEWGGTIDSSDSNLFLQ